MKIQPASIAQVREGRDGRRITIEEDVGNIAQQIHEIDPRLGLQWNEKGSFFMVVEYDERAKEERLVLTAQECDARIVQRVREIASPGYDYVGEMERMDQQAEREKDHAVHEQTGEIGERLAHAVRKDLNPGKIVVPKAV